ncbi:hypothetical protein MyAD_12115 [Mycolicibacterium neoaurum]|nr:hypothetical protein MyAD_12115 [Mycolicibacterium neoaurum]
MLEVVVTEPHDAVHLLGVCAGYEDGCWRCSQLSLDLLGWALDWVLTPAELSGVGYANALDQVGKALARIYKTTDYERRGEIGELLLHIILRRFMKTQKVISRMYFKDATNDTVKGFDAVHIVEPEPNSGKKLQLWLGESKFYTDSSSAMYAIIAELKEHLQADYLRAEFGVICDKIPAGWAYKEEVKALLDRTVSLDTVFESVVVPVFITFDSPTTTNHTSFSAEYKTAIQEELRAEWESFRKKLGNATLPRSVVVHLILLPMATKKALIDDFDERLKGWQAATRN